VALWFGAAGVLVFFGLLNTLGPWCPASGSCDTAAAYFRWLAPSLLPVLSLIIASYVHSRGRVANCGPTDKTLSRLTVGASAFYILILLMITGAFSLQALSNLERLDELTVWIAGPVQSMVLGLNGLFFLQQTDEPSSPDPAPAGD
tara:strand:- start:130 stop:567 length:438 start_codon:yes stop_codon:yes gene_type:complete